MDPFSFVYFLAIKVGAFIYFYHDKQHKEYVITNGYIIGANKNQ